VAIGLSPTRNEVIAVGDCASGPVSRHNGKLKLMNVNKRIQQLLSATKLKSFFDNDDWPSGAANETIPRRTLSRRWARTSGIFPLGTPDRAPCELAAFVF
jgi:hypothetical protein